MTNRAPILGDSPEALALLSGVDVVYTDLDGTLLGRGGSLLVGGDGTPTLAVAEAVLAVNVAGLKAVVCTGRNRQQSAEISRILGWRGFICELGCVIVPDRGAEPIYHTGTWPENTVPAGSTPFEVIERAGALDALGEAFPGKIENHAPYHLDREATHVLRGNIDVASAQEVLDGLDVDIDVIDNGIIHPIATTLTDVDEVHAYHLIPRGVTKQDAIARHLVITGRSPSQAAGIGDSATDVPMADVCALGVVVANALDDAAVREAIGARGNVYSTRAHRGDGWAEFAHLWITARTASG